jgi:hypothetical protein
MSTRPTALRAGRDTDTHQDATPTHRNVSQRDPRQLRTFRVELLDLFRVHCARCSTRASWPNKTQLATPVGEMVPGVAAPIP